jgi:demethylmenaquinone methyltransferase/2-methoxy-6-polyprenyl-1,4-benzoquinol methylase
MAKHYPPVDQKRGKKKQVQVMFDNIAPRYDLLNRVLSLGIDRMWRRRAIELLRPEQPQRILDIATGTADLAIAALDLNPKKVVGIDISEEMLAQGREKLKRLGLENQIVLRKGDAERLPFSDSQFDAVLVAFGVRNFENLDKGLSEIKRILRKKGTVVILEFSQPRHFPIKQLFGFYFKHLLPRIGGVVSNDHGAYQYLHDSVQAFPEGNVFLERLQKTGFKNPTQEPLTFGIASLYKASV